MLSASDESVPAKAAGAASTESEGLGVESLADAAVSGPIPMYVSVPEEEYSALLSADAEARADAVFEAMEEETYPVGEVDKLHAATYRVLAELVGEKDAAAIVYGGTDLDPQQETDGLRGNEVGVVDKLSSVLAGVELGAVENSYAVGGAGRDLRCGGWARRRDRGADELTRRGDRVPGAGGLVHSLACSLNPASRRPCSSGSVSR